ncbi:MAG: sensor histidine kinase [Chitinophagales bacterium]|nr:sensor histidine kinase [Chitinophagales bacterium]
MRKHATLILAALLLFSWPPSQAWAQTSADTSYINALTRKSFELRNSNPDSSELLAKQAIRLSTPIGYHRGLGDGYMYLGILKKNQSELDSALIYYKIALSHRLQLPESAPAGKAYTNIATAFNLKGIHDSALFYQLAALRIAEHDNDSVNLIICYNNLGFIHQRLHEYEKAENDFKQSLAIAKARRSFADESRALGNLGSLYTDMGQNELAKTFLWRNIASATSLNNPAELANAFNNLGAIYEDQNRSDSAFNYYEKSARLDSAIGKDRDLAIVLSNLGFLHYKNKNYSRAVTYTSQSLDLAMDVGDYQLIATNYQHLANTYEEMGDYKSSFRALQQYVLYNDTVFSARSDSTLAVVQTKYETEKKDHEIQLLSKDRELQSAVISRQRILRNALIALALLIVTAAWLFISRIRLRQQQRTLAERTRISGELHDDVAATLSGFSMYSEVVKQEFMSGRTEQALQSVENIGLESRELLDRLSDIVWAINPRNDKFEKIIARLRNYAMKVCTARGIDLDFSADSALHDLPCSLEVRNTLYLILKEAINNAAKYSAAKKLSVFIAGKGNGFYASVQDDGKGFTPAADSEGNGLRNMKQRAADIDAAFNMQSSPGQGTRIELTVPRI